jgi:hypothetical protein
LPPEFGNLRRLLEARMGKKGKREYVQVLRLLESFSKGDVRAAISDALERGVIGFDAVKHLVLCRIEKRPPRLDLLAYPYLPRAEVATTSASSYMGLLTRAV